MFMKKKFIIIPLILFCFLIKPLFALSQSASTANTQHSVEIEKLNQKIAEKRKKVQELEDSIDQVKKDINKKRLEATSLKNQISILDNRTTQAKLDIEETQAKLDALNLEIQSFELKIKDKEISIEAQKNMLAEFVRTLNYEHDKNYLEILAAYDNFSDFYNQLQYLQVVEKDLGRSAKSLRLAKADLDEKKEQTEERKESYEDLKKELEQEKKNYEEQIFTKSDLLDQTRSSEQTFQTLLSNLRKQYQSIEAEISSVEREVRNRLEAQEKLDKINDTNTSGLFSWPTQSRYITSKFRDPDYPFRNVFEHNAIDIRASQGTAIKAAASGYVGKTKTCAKSSCYSYVMLIHSGGLSTVYGHLSRIITQEDQFVTRGDIIGYSGGTPGTIGAGPFVTGAHLHFEVRKNGIPVNPVGYLVGE